MRTSKVYKTAKCLNCEAEIVYRSSNRVGRYCNNKCQQELRYKQYIERWQQGLEVGLRSEGYISAHIKRYLREKYDNQCVRCGWCEVNPVTGKVPVEVEHIDGDWRNNREDNLLLLCPNCHSLTPTYRALNKPSASRQRGVGRKQF